MRCAVSVSARFRLTIFKGAYLFGWVPGERFDVLSVVHEDREALEFCRSDSCGTPPNQLVLAAPPNLKIRLTFPDPHALVPTA